MQKPQTIVGLDLIRFAAALMVMWYHLAWWSWFKPSPLIDGLVSFPELTDSATFGGVGVEIFFVLSGFVIALTANGRTAAQFARSRFLRLFPAAWMCATLTLAVQVAYPTMPLLRIASFYLKTLVLWPTGGWIDGVYWTLTVELSFYMSVFLLLLIKRFDRFPSMLIAIGAPGTVMIAAWALGTDISWVYQHHYTALLLIRHGFLFAFGGFLWLAFYGQMRPAYWLAMAVFALIGALSIYASPSKAPLTSVAVWAVAVAAIVASVRWNEEICRPLGSWLPAVRLIGLATYPLYLIHNVIGTGIMRMALLAGFGSYLSLGIAIVAVVALSFLVAGLFEPRARIALVALVDARLPFRRGPATLP